MGWRGPSSRATHPRRGWGRRRTGPGGPCVLHQPPVQGGGGVRGGGGAGPAAQHGFRAEGQLPARCTHGDQQQQQHRPCGGRWPLGGHVPCGVLWIRKWAWPAVGAPVDREPAGAQPQPAAAAAAGAAAAACACAGPKGGLWATRSCSSRGSPGTTTSPPSPARRCHARCALGQLRWGRAHAALQPPQRATPPARPP